MRRVFAFLLVVLFIVQFAWIIPVVFAQSNNSSSGIAVYIQIIDKSVQEGDIITLSPKGYILGKEPYDPNIFGIVVKDPAIAFENSQANSYPVVSSGKVFMRVSTINGNIKKGDSLTTSIMPGVGQRATESGFIIATALEDYSANSTKDAGKILVVLNVGQGAASTGARGNLINAFNFFLSAPYMSPLSVLRYVFSAVMVILSFVIAVGYFGRISSLGIEALGRNPLAGRMIIFSIVLHVILALAIVGVGVAAAYLALVI
jgi:hypothetical protein